MTRSLALAALILGLARTAVHASCAAPQFAPVILTTRDTHLPSDGGMLVGFMVGADRDEDSGPDPSDVKWAANAGKQSVTLTRVALAPGLSVYKPPATTSAFSIANKAGRLLASFTVDPNAAANKLAAPQPKSLALASTKGFRSTVSTATLALNQAPPPEAVALILYRVDASGNTPLGFTRLPDTHDTLRSLEAARSGGHCNIDVRGYAMPTSGDKIGVAWVDAFGRLSPVSKPIVAK